MSPRLLRSGQVLKIRRRILREDGDHYSTLQEHLSCRVDTGCTPLPPPPNDCRHICLKKVSRFDHVYYVSPCGLAFPLSDVILNLESLLLLLVCTLACIYILVYYGVKVWSVLDRVRVRIYA